MRVTVSVDGQRLSSSKAKPGEVLTIPVPVSHAGRIVVEIDAAPAKDELTLRNNKAIVTLEGMREGCACFSFPARLMRASASGAIF